MIQDPFALTAVIAGITGLALWLHGRFRWAAGMSATLLVIIFGALLSNLGLVTHASPVYDAISGPLVSLAIVWLLLAVDLRAVRRAGPRMLGAFALAVGATIAGALVAAAIWGSAVFLFTITVVAVHGVALYGAAWLLRLDVESTAVASQAAIGGPSTTLALALAHKRYELALPGVVVGLLGYAVGNYAGIAVARLVGLSAWGAA